MCIPAPLAIDTTTLEVLVCGGTHEAVVATTSARIARQNGIDVEIIALSGFARSGKDEAARVLVEDFGFKQVAFADKLREMLYQLNPIVSMGVYENHHWDYERSVYVQDAVNQYGWDGYKETPYGPEIRRLLQRLGTEAGRQTLWDSIWIDAALANLPDDAKVVVSDARFFNEFDAVRDRGGFVWRIDREGVGPANDHASELEAINYPNFSLFLQNNGTLEEWRELIRSEYKKGRYREW